MKQTYSFLQGSTEWAAHRSKYFNASDTSAAMGISRYKSRSKLIQEIATGIVVEYDEATLARFEKGHEFEAIARQWAEEIIGTELFPVVISDEIDGLLLSASFDGIDMAEETTWEHKTGNKSLLASLEAGEIPYEYKPQIEQGLLISGAKRCLFMASSGEKETMRFVWYESDPNVRAALIAAWHQFHRDLSEYVPQEADPEVIAAPVAGFGALVMQVEGRVVACNLDAFQAGAQAFLDRLPKADELQSDQDFANAESAVKACAEAEDRIKSALDAAMAQAASIDEVFRAARHISELIRSARLSLDKSVKSRKESIRMEIMQDAQARLAEHVKNLNERIGWYNGCPIISPAAADFASAIKGKKTVASLRDACDTELASAKIATSEIADRIDANKKAMGDHAALFPDFPHVCTKTPEDFANLVAVRVQQHREAEDRRLQERAREEAAKAIQSTPPTPLPESGAPVAAIQPSPQPVADDGARIKLGDINAAIAPLSITADGLAQLGFQHIGTEKAAKLYRASDWPAIREALSDRARTAIINPLRKAA